MMYNVVLNQNNSEVNAYDHDNEKYHGDMYQCGRVDRVRHLMVTNQCRLQNRSQTIDFDVVKCLHNNNVDVKYGSNCGHKNNKLPRDNGEGLSKGKCNQNSDNVKILITLSHGQMWKFLSQITI